MTRTGRVSRLFVQVPHKASSRDGVWDGAIALKAAVACAHVATEGVCGWMGAMAEAVAPAKGTMK